MRPRLLTAAAALAAGATLTAVPAQAHSGGPWFGTYQVSVLGGDQHTSWNLNHTPTSRCDLPSNGSGSDEATFHAGAAQTVQIAGAGSVAFPFSIQSLELGYAENRDGSITTGNPEGGPECQYASGGGEDEPIPTPDCGTRSLSTMMNVEAGAGTARVEASAPASPDATDPYKDCPVMGEVIPTFPQPVVGTLPPLGPTLDGGLPDGIAKLSASEPITEMDTTGETHLDLELHLTRVLVVDALGMPSDVTLPVSADGDLTAPVTCPSGGACSGNVSLDITSPANGDEMARSAAAEHYPQPLPAFAHSLASSHFHLRPGQRGVKLKLPGGRTFARSLMSVALAIVVSTTDHHKSLSYVAGQAHVRP